MRLCTTFLLFLCIILQGDSTAVFSGSAIQHSPELYNRQVATQGSTAEKQTRFFESSAEMPGDKDPVVFEEEDNEEENSKKTKPAVEPVSLFFCEYISARSCITLTNKLFAGRHLHLAGNEKWLAIRVLRI
jgi:hypothetical protein